MTKAEFKPVFSKLIPSKKAHTCGSPKARGKASGLTFVKKDTYVYVRNRRYNSAGKLFKFHGCVLKENLFYLVEFSVYKCEDCGQLVSIRTCCKRISKEEAVSSGCKIRHFFVCCKEDLK